MSKPRHQEQHLLRECWDDYDDGFGDPAIYKTSTRRLRRRLDRSYIEEGLEEYYEESATNEQE